MRITQNQILLIMPPEDNGGKLRELLVSEGYEVITVTSLVASLQKVSEADPNLIICHHQVGPYSGFRIFNSLQQVLALKEIPFLLYMKEFIKDDVLIGLEMGIDNFIIEPYEKHALLTKIKRQVKRQQRVKVLETERFKLYFESTPIAKFISENEKLTNINKEFIKLTEVDKSVTPLPALSEIFDFSENEQHELDLRKCFIGLKEYCVFKSVPLLHNKKAKFDIHIVLNDYFGKNIFTGEIIPVQNHNSTNGIYNKVVNDTEKPQVMLTEREKQVLELSGKGFSIKQIAEELGLSPRTIEKHRANIMEKTDTSSIIEAIYFLQE